MNETLPAEGERWQAAAAMLRESLCAGFPIRLRAQGSSMVPSIWPGDILTVAPTATTPAFGTVILSVGDQGWRAHRVVGQRLITGKLALLTRGDALETIDPAVSADRVLGEVIACNGRPLGLSRVTWMVRLIRFLDRSGLLTAVFKLRVLSRRLLESA